MPLYMLDTNTASAALRGSPGIDERLQRLDPAQWCISAVTRAELRYGVALKPDATKLARYVEAFLQATTTAPSSRNIVPAKSATSSLGSILTPSRLVSVAIRRSCVRDTVA